MFKTFEDRMRDEEREALANSGIDNIELVIDFNEKCLKYLEDNPLVTAEQYDAWRVEALGCVPCLRTIKRVGITGVIRVCHQTIDICWEAVAEIV